MTKVCAVAGQPANEININVEPTAYVIYAYGTNFVNNFPAYHGTTRGSRSLPLLVPNQKVQLSGPIDEASFVVNVRIFLLWRVLSLSLTQAIWRFIMIACYHLHQSTVRSENLKIRSQYFDVIWLGILHKVFRSFSGVCFKGILAYLVFRPRSQPEF